MRIGLVWPPQRIVVESLFRHYNGLAEVAGYLINTELVKENSIDVEIHDCAVKAYSMSEIADMVYKCEIMFICINMNNINDAIEFSKVIRSFETDKCIVAYGEGVCCNPNFFAKGNTFDYVIATGMYEVGIEVILAKYLQIEDRYLSKVLRMPNAYSFEGKILWISKQVYINSEEWGIPAIDLLPIADYKRIGNDELHITACKGCPFKCEFCNEKHVSGMRLQYRPIHQIIEFMKENKEQFSTIYLDASTFTYDKKWVMDFCAELKRLPYEEIIPWKTCTRLDCLDEELVTNMGQAGCKRISIGVESMDSTVQNRNGKVIDNTKLLQFYDWCTNAGIVPRILFIIGLGKKDPREEVEQLNELKKRGFELRFRILQDYDFLLKSMPEDVSYEQLKSIDRIEVPAFIDKEVVNYCRQLEYPLKKK